eukprot:3389286-Prymnesium_polylepis.1
MEAEAAATLDGATVREEEQSELPAAAAAAATTAVAEMAAAPVTAADVAAAPHLVADFAGPTVLLQRGMTAAAFDDYLEGDASLAALAGSLGSGVDGDLLIEMIAAAGKADALALKSFFSEDASIGLLGELALRLNSFAQVLVKEAKDAQREKKKELSEEKRQAL